MNYLVSGRYIQSGQPFEPFVVAAQDEVQAFSLVRRDDLAIDRIVPYQADGNQGIVSQVAPPRFEDLPPEVIQAHRTAAARDRARPPSKLVQLGVRFLSVFAVCLLVGRGAVRIFFPERIGQGLTPEALMVLIPIWSIGGIGLLLIMVGKLRQWFT